MAGIAAAQEPMPPPPLEEPPEVPQEEIPQEIPEQEEPLVLPESEQEQETKSEVMPGKLSATATVEKIDAKKRQLTLKDEQGNKFKVHVPEQAMMNLENIKKGDKLDVDYYSAVALNLKKKGAKGEQITERTPGQLPGGLVARKVTGTVEVMKVDKAENKLTVKGPTGETDTINVTDPALQGQLANIKKGDKIEVSYAEAIAITVMPQQQQQQESELPQQGQESEEPQQQEKEKESEVEKEHGY